MLQYRHDYHLPEKAMDYLTSARRLLAIECIEGACDRVDEARIALDKYLAQENVCPVENEENGWVKMDDALQLTFTREQLDYIRDLFGERLREFPESKHALAHLEIINRCQELLGCPCFDNVQEFVANKAGNWSLISSRV